MNQKSYTRMKTKIEEIWNELEQDASLTSGVLLRRYSSSVLPDIYVALQQPEHLRGVALRIRSDNQINVSRYSTLQDVSLSIVPEKNDTVKCFLLIRLLNSNHKDVFATLCEDLIWEIAQVNDEEIFLKVLLDRFEKWKSLFDRATQGGLSSEEQRGLYGELYFLRKWISLTADFQKCIFSWLGPQMELRDFQSGKWGVEVKTTYSNNHQRIYVSSERQLDMSNLDTLFLFHLSLESQHLNGENLNQMISSIINLLSEDALAMVQFKSRLLQAGYYFEHSDSYDDNGYHVRQESFYSVRDDFPRIEESDLRAGVGDVKYSIIISNYDNYLVTDSFVFEMISNYGWKS